MKPELKAGFIICHTPQGGMQAISVRNIASIAEVNNSKEFTYITTIGSGVDEACFLKVKGSFFDYLELLTNKLF